MEPFNPDTAGKKNSIRVQSDMIHIGSRNWEKFLEKFNLRKGQGKVKKRSRKS